MTTRTRQAMPNAASPRVAPQVAALDAGLAGSGLFVRGGFHPQPEDDVPPLSGGGAPGTVILVGNAGPALWQAFQASTPDASARHPLDSWVDAQLDRVAAAAGAEVIYPTRKPYPPIQRWGRRAEPVYPSPVGLMIHPEYGLWHVYRGAFLYAERLDLPPRSEAANPCESCANKPCLKACPVSAFTPVEMDQPRPAAFDPAACVDHVESAAGGPCRRVGCLTRRACPVGRDYRYPEAASAFHMAAVVRTVRRMLAE
jgi:hypothetical protein